VRLQNKGEVAGRHNLTFMRHKFIVVTVNKWLKSMYIYGFTEVIAKLKPGYHSVCK